MQSSTVLAILFFAAAAYARTNCKQDANYCGWNLVSKGYDNVDDNTLYYCQDGSGDVMPLNFCQGSCEGPTAHCV